MKIVAVIPARAGSKGIPNKNIRLINGKPLIWYAINNAKNSKYIDEVIVSSDSKEIEVIAKQMGVTFRDRDEVLCGDAVTLDSVIYDAVKDIKCDYVITMQPTSPTLKVETLDNAIEYMTSKPELETVMSVINRPHLSWREENGKKVPNYTERLNRQYLPANYLETGAFFISKRSVVKENSRFGKNVDVFEIGEDEAIDIDTYADLKQVQDIMARNTVAIYVNGNNTRGIGHIYRALEMADEFNSAVDIYYDINQTDVKVFGETTHKLLPVNGISELFRILEDKKYDYFINDILTTSIDYMIGLRNMLPDAKIINFEDDGEGNMKADLVFNALYQQDAL
ncbi:MAG: cytidyltransferase, partial [Erysipelotrichaceae bacterium]|nr:cytidyltransferase [Erysipelotrichaceae bacterium]